MSESTCYAVLLNPPAASICCYTSRLFVSEAAVNCGEPLFIVFKYAVKKVKFSS